MTIQIIESKKVTATVKDVTNGDPNCKHVMNLYKKNGQKILVCVKCRFTTKALSNKRIEKIDGQIKW